MLRALPDHPLHHSLSLTAEQREALGTASALAPDYSTMTDSPGLASAVFGGASVEGWR